MKIYTGVGSRKTPERVLQLMEHLGIYLGAKSWLLRTGAADGADSAFEKGQERALGQSQIFLPWEGFNGRSSREIKTAEVQVFDQPEWWTERYLLAAIGSDHMSRLSDGALKLHMRNVHQIIGPNEDSPRSNLVICWTPGGRLIGGTATAIKLARNHQVPVLNLGHAHLLERVWNMSAEALENYLSTFDEAREVDLT